MFSFKLEQDIIALKVRKGELEKFKYNMIDALNKFVLNISVVNRQIYLFHLPFNVN